MAKFLYTFSYSVDGAKGLMKEGAAGRRAAVEKLVQSAGGRVEVMYYSFGDADGYLIVDLPDSASAAAVSLNVAASGGARIKTSPLMSVEEFDQATKKKITYRPPGA